MIRSIDACRGAEVDFQVPAVAVSARIASVREVTGIPGRFEAAAPVGLPRTGGPRPIGELLQQVLAQYQLGDNEPKPLPPLILNRQTACHAPSLSLS
jgi:hypothetical protein